MRRTYFLLAIILVLGMATQSMALSMGAISTDRFGYTGVVKRYDTLADAQAATNQVGEDIEIGNRDLSLYIVNDYLSYDENYNIMMGSWWYSTDSVGKAGGAMFAATAVAGLCNYTTMMAVLIQPWICALPILTEHTELNSNSR